MEAAIIFTIAALLCAAAVVFVFSVAFLGFVLWKEIVRDPQPQKEVQKIDIVNPISQPKSGLGL